jgi:thermitase
MVKKLFLTFFVFTLFLILIPAQATSSEFSSEEIIVKFKANVSESQVEESSNRLGGKVFAKLLLPQTFLLKVPERQAERFVQIFSQNPLVEYAEPDYLATALEDYTPNDPYLNNEWGLSKVKATQAWDLAKGLDSIKIAILDTGIDKDHEDLSSKVDQWVNFSSSRSDDDLNGHGSIVAGVAAAATNNGLGIAGLGFNTKLLSVKVLGDNGSGYYSSIVNGIKWAADNGAKVINLSLGGPSQSSALAEAINYAWQKGVVLTCAVGNAGNTSKTYPAYYTNCLAVAASDENDQRASFSSYGTWVDVVAPGNNIFSTFTNHQNKISKNKSYGYASGTSFSTPFVSGLAALIFGADPTLGANQVRSLIEDNADKITGTGTYWAKGRINAYQSISSVPGMALPTPVATEEPTPTPTPTPTPVPTTTPTATPTPSPKPTLTPTPSPMPTPTPSLFCRLFPQLCH